MKYPTIVPFKPPIPLSHTNVPTGWSLIEILRPDRLRYKARSRILVRYEMWLLSFSVSLNSEKCWDLRYLFIFFCSYFERYTFLYWIIEVLVSLILIGFRGIVKTFMFTLTWTWCRHRVNLVWKFSDRHFPSKFETWPGEHNLTL